jgi:tetratricopeptide (TPR) repeat protein
MRRPLVILAVALAVHVVSATQSEAPQSIRVPSAPPAVAEENIRAVFDAYAGGDDLAVERWLAGVGALSNARYVEGVMSKPAPWNRARAAFVMEVALRQFPRTSLIPLGQVMVVSRPSAFGTNAAEDRFEILWHQLAVALLETHPQVDLLTDYLDVVEPRLDDARKRGVTVTSRLPLARAFASAIVCCWKRVAGEQVRDVTSRNGVTIEMALAQFERAAEDPALRDEARIRAAKLLADNGRVADAVAMFERVPNDTDPALGYVHQVTYARLLDGLDRPADAAAAYRAALTFSPGAQRAGIGYAAALLRQGQAQEAAQAADAARRMTDDAALTISRFNKGDMRFAADWLTELRRLRR